MAIARNRSEVAIALNRGGVIVCASDRGLRSKESGAFCLRLCPEVSSLLVDYSGDGRYLASITVKKRERSIRVWALPSGTPVCELRLPASALALDPHGRMLVSGDCEGRVILWDLPKGRYNRELHRHDSEVAAVAFDRTGSVVASADDTGVVSVQRVAEPEPRDSFDTNRAIRVLRVAAGGAMVACAGAGLTVRDSRRTPHLANLLAKETPVSSLAFAPDGSAFCAATFSVSGKDTSRIIVFCTRTLQTTHILDAGRRALCFVRFLDQETLYASCLLEGGQIVLRQFDLRTGAFFERAMFQIGGQSSPRSAHHTFPFGWPTGQTEPMLHGPSVWVCRGAR